MPLVRIYANLSLCFSLIQHFCVCVCVRKKERERHSYQSEAGCSAPQPRLSLAVWTGRVADRLTAIHFADSHARLAYGSRSHAGSRYWRGRFIQFLLMRRTFPGSHPLGCLINVLLHIFFARARVAINYCAIALRRTITARLFLILAGGRWRLLRDRFKRTYVPSGRSYLYLRSKIVSSP